MNIEFQKEDFPEMKPELEKLMLFNWDETGELTSNPDPYWNVYETLNNMDSLLVYTARTSKGTLVGYAIFMVQFMLHDKTRSLAANDALFIHPMVRKSSVGIRFIKYCIKELKKVYIGGKALDIIQISSNRKRDVGSLLTRFGFEQIETVYYLEVI